MESNGKSQVITDVEMIDADGIIDSMLSEKDKEYQANTHASRRAWVFMTALDAAVRQARSRPELTFKWGSRFWSNKPILGPIKLHFDAECLDIKYGPDSWEHLRCGVRGSHFWLEVWNEPFLRNTYSWPHPDARATSVKNVSDAFSLVMEYLVRSENRVPQK